MWLFKWNLIWHSITVFNFKVTLFPASQKSTTALETDKEQSHFLDFKTGYRGLPSGTVDKCLPANAGDTRFDLVVHKDSKCFGATKPTPHPQLLESEHSRAHGPQLLSLCAATTEACVFRACAPQQKPMRLQQSSPAAGESLHAAMKAKCNQN